MTARGEVEIAEEDARSIIHSVTVALHAKNQFATLPDPATLLHTLCAHHVLERMDYPSVAFKFQHQQFQEFYAARFLATALAQLAGNGDETARQAFAASCINKPMWEESLHMAAEDIRLRSEVEATTTQALEEGARLIILALGIDPILAGDLSRLSGPAVWNAVRTKVGEVLRGWYAIVDEVHHQRCALAAMLATGYEDFADILVPLLTDKNRQARISTYDAGTGFLSDKPRNRSAPHCRLWDEEARQIRLRGDPSWLHGRGRGELRYKRSEREGAHAGHPAFGWIGATEALTRILNLLNDAALEASLPALIAETIPAEARQRVVGRSEPAPPGARNQAARAHPALAQRR